MELIVKALDTDLTITVTSSTYYISGNIRKAATSRPISNAIGPEHHMIAEGYKFCDFM